MSALTYPASIYIEPRGWGLIFKGHNLDPLDIATDLHEHYGEGSVITDEYDFAYQPRVKWCGRYDFPCDMEGDWHSHWRPVKPGEGTAYTVAQVVHLGGAA